VPLLISTVFLKHQPLYLDPGTGSFLFQMLLAALMGILLAVKIYWRKIKGFFKKSQPDQANIKINPDDKDE
jgi:hypothetical protein